MTRSSVRCVRNMRTSPEELPADSNAEMTITTQKEVSAPVVLALVVAIHVNQLRLLLKLD